MNNRIQRFFGQSWHICPDAIEPFLLSVARDSTEEESGPMAKRPAHDRYGDSIPALEMTDDGIAIVPVHGAMVKGATGSDKYRYGVTSHSDIEDDLDESLARGARAILLDINSPGGTVAGTPELAAKVDKIGGVVDIYSFNGQLSASAAEYFSAGVSARFGVRSSINGSIGTILQTLDISKMLDMMGVTVNVFASGKYKGTGNPVKPMTDDQREYVQSLVKKMGGEFKDHMQMHRPLQDEHLQGQVFTGQQALDIGLLDQIVSSRAEVLSLI